LRAQVNERIRRFPDVYLSDMSGFDERLRTVVALGVGSYSLSNQVLIAYGVSTKPSEASASYSLCLLQPLLIVAATYSSTAKPAVGHPPSKLATVAVIGEAAVSMGPLVGGIGGNATGVTPLTMDKENVAKSAG
jgi:hypothetical protein